MYPAFVAWGIFNVFIDFNHIYFHIVSCVASESMNAVYIRIKISFNNLPFFVSIATQSVYLHNSLILSVVYCPPHNNLL